MSTDRQILISPSIIASDLSTMGEMVKTFDPAVIDLLHMDVMDGHFVPNLTFGPGYIKALKKHTSIPLDIHLMIEKPEDSLEQYFACDPWAVTIHYESTRFPARLLTLIREHGARAGLSLNPATPVSAIFDLLTLTDIVLIMSVDPGFYGQSFLPFSLDRVGCLARYIKDNDLNVEIAIDGGINGENVKSVVDAGASIIVAGSAAFLDGDPNSGVRALKDHITVS